MVRRAVISSLRIAALAALAALAGCSGTRAGGPAWPKSSDPETDGGESLAPRQASSVSAIERAEDATPSAPASASASDGAAAPASAPSARPDGPTPEAPPSREPDILTTEEITIEIED